MKIFTNTYSHHLYLNLKIILSINHIIFKNYKIDFKLKFNKTAVLLKNV